MKKHHSKKQKHKKTLDANKWDVTDTSIPCLNKYIGRSISQNGLLMMWEYEQCVPYSWSPLIAEMGKDSQEGKDEKESRQEATDNNSTEALLKWYHSSRRVKMSWLM